MCVLSHNGITWSYTVIMGTSEDNSAYQGGAGAPGITVSAAESQLVCGFRI